MFSTVLSPDFGDSLDLYIECTWHEVQAGRRKYS
jgi:hypothetical protein